MGLSNSKPDEDKNQGSGIFDKPRYTQDVAQLSYGLQGLSLRESASSRVPVSSLTTSSTLATSAISLVSHAHGRQRRQERGIEKRELQEAIKYGRKEPANPGRDGKPRWRYTHKGVVYITDETSRHEITSWRLDDAPEPAPAVVEGQEGAGTAHFVMVVDMSGSMRKDDVQGHTSRATAVYDCLAKDLVEPQLKQGTEGIKVTLIEMSDQAKVLRKRGPLDQGLLDLLNKRKHAYPRSHGNYLPALEAASKILKEEAGLQSQLFLVFLSDGAPSDHVDMECDHGICVWQPDGTGMIRPNGKDQLHSCGHTTVQTCRHKLRQRVETECVRIIRNLGDMLGRDRVQIHTVAFGPEKENYRVLENMAKALPRNSFQKLHLSFTSLKTAFSSLTSTLTTLRTELGGRGTNLTLRPGLASQRVERKDLGAGSTLHHDEWDFYVGQYCIAKLKWDARADATVPMPFFKPAAPHEGLARGVIHNKHWFARGAERVVYQCREVMSNSAKSQIVLVGPKLVAKQSQYKEQMYSADFHRTFLRTQAEAEALAQKFNLCFPSAPASWRIRFLPCWLYSVWDFRYSSDPVEFLVEEELEGQYTKWNNNAGGVAKGLRSGLAHGAGGGLGAIAEDDEEEEEEEESGGSGSAADVPQCFSHFTYVMTGGQKLVCDLQGVWNSTDGFTFTDPVIHHVSGSKMNGATDKGPAGMRRFFETHVCNDLCKKLGLQHTRLT